MKKTQKRLGNKGFSLVELIVVIAIMAVLVGVLAPTLIRNVEKSRESTDLQTLDSLRSSVSTALSIETVNEKLPAAGDTFTIANGSLSGGDADFRAAVSSELSDDGVLSAKMKSKSGQSGAVTIHVAADGKVDVSVKKDGAVVKAAKSKTDMIVE